MKKESKQPSIIKQHATIKQAPRPSWKSYPRIPFGCHLGSSTTHLCVLHRFIAFHVANYNLIDPHSFAFLRTDLYAINTIPLTFPVFISLHLDQRGILVHSTSNNRTY